MAGLESSASEEQITINVPNALETIQQILSTSKEEFSKAFQGTEIEEVEGLAGDTEVIPQGEDVSGDIATGTADMARDATESLDVDSLLEPEKNETPITDNNAGIDSIPSAEVVGTGETVAAGDSAGVGTAGAVEAGASTESMGTTQGGTTGTGGTSAPSGDSASMGGSSSEGVSVETGGETGASGEAGNASGLVLTNDEFIEQFFDLTEDQRAEYIGSLSQTEYEELVAKVEAQYRQNISDYESAIADTKTQLMDLKFLLSWVSDKYEAYERYYQSVLDEVNGCFYDESRRYQLEKYGITEEDYAQGLEYVIAKALSSDLVQTNLTTMEEDLNEQLQIEIDANPDYQMYSGMTYAQLLAIKQELENGLSILQALKTGDKKSLSTAQYDLLIYSEDFQEFLQQDTTINPDDIEGKTETIGYPYYITHTIYSYTDYKETHPDANPIDFYLAVKKKGTENNIIIGIGNIDKIEELIAISEYQHSVAEGTDTSRVPLTDTNIDYLTIYIYKYYQNPSEAEQLLEDIDQVFKYYEGALEANKQIEQLGELIDSDKIRGLYDQICTLDVNDPEQVQAVLDQIKGLDIKDKQTVLDLIKSLDLDDKENLQQNLYHILDVASGLQKIKETLAADLNVSIDGLGDGIYDFFEGFAKLFWDGELSAQDYKVMLYLSYLEQHSYFLDRIYKTSSTIGNLLPTVTISVILNTVCPGLGATQVPIIGGTGVSNISLLLMSLSSFGTIQNQLKFQGYSDWQAYSYAVLASGSVFLFQRLGGILGLSNTPGSNFLENWFKEAGQQIGRQAFITLVGNGLILGEEIDITNMTQEAFDIFLSSLIVSGVLNLYTKGLTIVANGIRYHITGADTEAIAKYLDSLDRKTSFRWSELEAVLKYKDTYGISMDDALILNQAAKMAGCSAETIMKQNVTFSITDSTGKSAKVNLSSLSQWTKFIKYTRSGMSESEALNALLDEYAEGLQYDGWLTPSDIKAHVREAYDRLPDADKLSETNPNGLSFEDFLKIKLQLIPYDPVTQTPHRYAEVQAQMQKSNDVTLFWSQGDIIRFLNGTYGNGVGRAATETQDSAAFAIPSSEVSLPSDFSSWSYEKQADYLSNNLGLNKSNFLSGAYRIRIDQSIYGNDWTYSDPYTQGSNQDYVPGMNTSDPKGKTEVVIPRVDNVVQSMDSATRSKIDRYLAAGMVDEATSLFLTGINNGTIILRPGVTIEKL